MSKLYQLIFLSLLNEYGFTPEQWTQRMNELIEDMNNIPIIF